MNMPILKSGAKRMRSDAKKRATNLETVSELKTLFKKLAALAQEKSKDAAERAKELVSLFDKAVSRGIIPKGRANRKKARIARLFKKS
jgi:small subunit ribosomal protein S20